MRLVLLILSILYFSQTLACTASSNGVELKDLDGKRKEVLKHNEEGTLVLKGYIKDGIAIGKWMEWYSDGSMKAEYSFLNGLEQGERTTWYLSGQIAEQGNMLFGTQEGTWKIWSETGILLAETSYKKGVEQGERTHFYASGKKKSEASIQGGLQNGLRIFSYENGQMKAKGYFRMDIKQGPEEYFREDGTWEKTICFLDGQEQKVWREVQPLFSEELCEIAE
jgi:antitoxin component YwqK of YwqJK toxin-antitoxin module